MAFASSLSAGFLLRRGLITENTIFGMAISLCPAIAVTANVKNGFFMGVSVFVVQSLLQVIISLFRRWIHPAVRIPIFMVIIAGLVTITDRCVYAFAPAVHAEIGLYIQLIVAFASILAGAETFASKVRPMAAFIDGIARGAGFLAALVLIGGLRELLGQGSLCGFEIMPIRLVALFSLPAGGFFAVGMLMAGFAFLRRKRYPVAECAACQQAGTMTISNPPTECVQ